MVGETLIIIINILQAVLFFYFLIAVLYFAFFSIAGLFTYHPKKKKDDRLRKFAVLIPG